jgi:hypothetical protein
MQNPGQDSLIRQSVSATCLDTAFNVRILPRINIANLFAHSHRSLSGDVWPAIQTDLW